MHKVALYGTLSAGFATLANAVHGGSHAGQQVPLAAWQWAYVVVVVFCAPVAAAVMVALSQALGAGIGIWAVGRLRHEADALAGKRPTVLGRPL